MHELTVKRLRFTTEADTWLKVLKAKTGLTPNILCRAAFCLSLSEPGIPTALKEDADSQREINRYTLLGEYDTLFEALLRQRLMQDALDEVDVDDQFRRHVHRGISLLASRVKSLSDLARLAETRSS